MTAPAALHQVVSTLEPDDAVGNEARLIRRLLRERGHDSEIFAAVHTGREPEPTRGLDDLLAGARPAAVLYHLATASPATERLAESAQTLVLIHHSVTPAHWFYGIDRVHFDACRAATEDSQLLRDRVAVAIAHSEFARGELTRLGFLRTAAVPLLLDLSDIAAAVRSQRDKPTLLTVGRVAPNKCVEDVIRLLHALRRDAEPDAELWIAGDDTRLPVYADALRRLVRRLGEERAVHWLGRLPRDELMRRYRSASLYVSMSEHEGFGGPLVEAMQADLPVLAYDAAAVGETLGPAGMRLCSKDPELAAEAASLLLRDHAARSRQIDLGRRRSADLDARPSFATLTAALAGAGIPVA